MSSDAPVKRKRLTWAELLGIIFVLAVLLILLVPPFLMAHRQANVASCQNNLKQWGVIFKMYASENSGYYPRCATKNERTNTSSLGHGILPVPFGPSVYPDFLSDLNLYFCSSSDLDVEDLTSCPGGHWCNIQTGELDPRNFNDCSFTYIGWMTTGESELAALIACLLISDREHPSDNPHTADRDFGLDEFGGAASLQAALETTTGISPPAVAGNGYSPKILRLKEGAERFLLTEIRGLASAKTAQGYAPIMWDRVNGDMGEPAHAPGGCNVLYMEGHAEFRKYPSEYPLSKLSADLAGLIDHADPLAP